MPAERSVKVCPKCRSKNITLDGWALQMGTFYVCKDCGYRGPLVIEEYKLPRKGK